MQVPLQHSIVLHNVPAAAGDDASHNHAQDETPTLRSGPRGNAGIDNGDVDNAQKPTIIHTAIHTDQCLCMLVFKAQQKTHIHRVARAKPLCIKTLTPKESDSAKCQRQEKNLQLCRKPFCKSLLGSRKHTLSHTHAYTPMNGCACTHTHVRP